MDPLKFQNTVSDGIAFCEYSKSLGFSTDKVFTSKDFEIAKQSFDSKKLGELGLVDPQFSARMPSNESISKFILPLTFLESSIFAMVYGEPNTIVKEHSHTKGFLRIIMFGEYTFTGLPQGDIVLGVGDWIYIPSGQKYGYITGPNGGGGGCCYCVGQGGGQCGANKP